MINDDIEAQNLKTHGIIKIIRLTALVQVGQVRLPNSHSLDHNILNLFPKQISIVTFFLYYFQNCFKRPLMTHLFFIIIFFILLKFAVEFIDSIVGEMHVEVLHIIISRTGIILSGKSSKTHFMNIDS